MSAGRVPLAASSAFYSTTTIGTKVILLGTSVTSLPDTVSVVSDLASYEISTGGNYTAQTGITMSALNRVQDETAGVVEYDVGAATYSSTATNLTVTYRWAVVCRTTGATIMAAYDFGTTQTITAGQLTLTVDPSPYISGSYPVLRLRRP